MLVLVVPRGGGFVCLNVGSRLVLVFLSIAFGVCLRSALVLRGVCGGFVSPRCWLVLVVVLRLGLGLLRVPWFRIVFSLFGAALWSTHAKIGQFS